MMGMYVMKWINLIIIPLLIIGIVGISGCTQSKAYNVTLSNEKNATMLSNFNDQQALNIIKPTQYDSQNGYSFINYGTKTINGINVYYNVYTDLNNNNTINGELYFNKNGKWYMILWSDIPGNPNKKDIENEISNKIKAI